jgi:hypothetical protein
MNFSPQEDVPNFTNSSDTLTGNDHTEPEGGSGDSQPTFTVGDEEEAEVEEANLDESNPRSLNISADSTLSDPKIGADGGKNVSTSSILEDSS